MGEHILVENCESWLYFGEHNVERAVVPLDLANLVRLRAKPLHTLMISNDSLPIRLTHTFQVLPHLDDDILCLYPAPPLCAQRRSAAARTLRSR